MVSVVLLMNHGHLPVLLQDAAGQASCCQGDTDGYIVSCMELHGKGLHIKCSI